jgi:hypothetical protein
MNSIISALAKVLVSVSVPVLLSACDPVVKIDVQCDKLCIAAPGPTLPGFSLLDASAQDAGTMAMDGPDVAVAGLDGAIDSSIAEPVNDQDAPIDAYPAPSIAVATVEWTSVLGFNDVLKQMPNGSSDNETKVLLTTVSLVSTESLDFVDTVDVSISRNRKADGGSSGGRQLDASVAGSLACETVGGRLYVAHFQRVGEAALGNKLPLTLVAPDLNIFDCLKDDPTEFHVAMTFRNGQHPTRETPLTLSACVRTESHMGRP